MGQKEDGKQATQKKQTPGEIIEKKKKTALYSSAGGKRGREVLRKNGGGDTLGKEGPGRILQSQKQNFGIHRKGKKRKEESRITLRRDFSGRFGNYAVVFFVHEGGGGGQGKACRVERKILPRPAPAHAQDHLVFEVPRNRPNHFPAYYSRYDNIPFRFRKFWRKTIYGDRFFPKGTQKSV